jgi:hypothetical protein
MSFDAIKDAITTDFGTLTLTGVTKKYANETAKVAANASWVRMTIMDAGSQRNTLTGNPATGQKFYGVLFFQAFVPSGSGIEAMETVKDTLANHYRELSLAVAGGQPIRFGSEVTVSQGDDDTWFQENVSIPFEREII